MQLYLDSFGAFLGIKNGMFWLKAQGREGRAIALRKVKCIFACKGVQVSSDALFLALEYNIPFIFIDQLGRSQGHIWTGQFGSISTIRKNQALFSQHFLGMQWVQNSLEQRLRQQLANLAQLAQQATISTTWQSLYQQQQSIFKGLQTRWVTAKLSTQSDLAATAATFRGWEGTATRHYYQLLSGALPQAWQFEKRSKRPAYDPFNALLNYLYGMLYPLVELSLIKAGLDPYMGILHTDRHQRPTLVYDCIECYRHWAEWVALALVLEQQLHIQQDFAAPTARIGIQLLASGKQVVIPAMLDYLQQRVSYQGQQRKRTTIIDLDLQRLASYLKTIEF